MNDVTTTNAWQRYQKGLDFMRSDGLIDKVRKNERFFAGDQWYGVEAKDLPKPVFNIIKRIVQFKVASVMAEDVAMNFFPQGISEKNPRYKEYEEAAELFTRYSETMWEKLKQTTLNEETLTDAANAGLGLTHYYWDKNLITNGDLKGLGDVKGEIIDSINYFPGNPNTNDIQSQPYIIISYRKLVSEIRKEAKEYGVKEELLLLIQGDKDTEDQVFDKGFYELDDNSKVTVLLEYYKKDGQVYYRKATKNVVICEDIPTNLTRYPIAGLNWGKRKRSCYGTAETTEIIPNQLFINKAFAMAMISMQRTAFPKAVVDINRVGKITNDVSTAIKVKGDVNGAFKYAEAGMISYDVYKLLDEVIEKTKDMQGANENALGETRPENTSAIIAQQKASAIPLETVKRQFHQYLEDVGLIWADFWKNKYVNDRSITVKNEEGHEETVIFYADKYKDIDLHLKIDIGANTQWSEVLSVNTLNDLLQAERITFIEYLERYPQGVIPKQQKLLEKRKQEEIKDKVLYELMARFVEGLPPNAKQVVQSMEPEEMEAYVMELIMMDPQQQALTIQNMNAQPQA